MNIIESIRKVYLKIKNYIENTDLNINSWLIKWGYMNGYLQNEQIQTTKYNIIYQLMVIIILSLNITRFFLLLLSGKKSKISKQFGDWSYFIGPRHMINGMSFICCSYIIMIIIFFKFCMKNLKMFYWLNIMEYDFINRCFFKLNLNESDSKMFIKRIFIFVNIFKWFTYSFIIFFAFVNFLSVFKYINEYYLNYFIGITIFLPPLYYCNGFAFGLSIILYLVSLKLLTIC